MLKTIQVFAFAIAEFSLHIEMNNAERKSVRPFLVAKFSDIRKPKAIILEVLLNINQEEKFWFAYKMTFDKK